MGVERKEILCAIPVTSKSEISSQGKGLAGKTIAKCVNNLQGGRETNFCKI